MPKTNQVKSKVKGKQVKKVVNRTKPQPTQKKQVKTKATLAQAPYARIQGGVGHLTINGSGQTTVKKYEHPIVSRSNFNEVRDFLDPMDLKKFDKFVQMDPRGYDSVGSVKSVFMDNTLDLIPYVVDTKGEVLAGTIYGVVCEALARGYIPNAASESYPYFAYVYMTNMLVSAANNATPKEMTIPRWLAHLVQALVQTRVKSRAGHVSYKFTVPDTWDDNYVINMGPILYARSANLGVKSINSVWPGSYWRVTGPPATYSQEEGELAAQEIWQFLKSCYEDDKHTMVSIGQANFMTSDASAFAVNISSPGGGFRNTGGPRVELTLEVPAFRPMFSLLRAQTSNDIVPNRAANFPRSYGGDSIWLGGQLLRRPDSLYQSKTPPIFKFIDFYEIVDVFFLYVRYACEAKMLDPDTEAAIEDFGNANVYFEENVQCPLTRQEVAIMLRSVLMALFADTQPYVQGLFPRVPASLASIEFVSFISGVGTHPVLGASSMLMPLLLKNNLLALTERIFFPGFIEGTSVNNMTQYTPVLGCYNGTNDLGSLTFAGFKNGTGTVNYEPFKVNPAEVAIDMIDGKFAGGYAQINDPDGVNRLIVAWNDWSTRMADYFWSTTPFSIDAGNPALWTLGFTNNWTFSIIGEEKEKELKEKVCYVPEHKSMEKNEETPEKPKTFEEIRDKRWTSKGDTPPGNNFYSLRDVVALTTSTRPFKSAWEYIQYFIKPVNPLPNTLTPVVPRQSTAYTRISCLNQEFFSLVTSTGNVGTNLPVAENLREKHMKLAKLCIKSKYAEKGDFQELMESWEKNGQAGILSSIAAGLIGSIFPDAKPIVESIAGVIPF